MTLDWQPIARGLEFPEGPIAHPDGSVWVVEIKRGTLTRIAKDGAADVIAHCGGGPNGAAFDADGRVVVCNNGGFDWVEAGGLLIPTSKASNYRGGSIQLVDPKTGTVDLLYVECGGVPLSGPNDLVMDGCGGFYFTDTGKHDARVCEYGALYYASTSGAEIRMLAHGLNQPNGCGLAPDGRRVYFSETHTARLWQFDVTAPGKVRGGATPFAPGDANFVYGSPRFEYFDSLAVEADGNLCVATLLSGGITVISPQGDFVEFVAGPGDPGITNLCFSPIDPYLVYVTASCTGVLYSARWPRPGLMSNVRR